MSGQERLGAEKVAGLDQSAEPCWFPTTPGGMAFEWGDGCPHWQSEDEGHKTLGVIRSHYGDDPPTLVLTRADAPCWHLTCAECGYRYDQDEWVSHFPDKTEAEHAAEDCDWHIEAGRLLCPECVLPPAVPACTCNAGDAAEFAAQHATLCPRFAHPRITPPKAGDLP